MKKMVTLLLAGFIVLATAQTPAAATKAPATKTEKATTEKVLKVENTVCPVMGSKVDPAVKTVAYKGKNYGFCCNGCPEAFKKEPEKYLKKVKKEEVKQK